MEQTDALTGLPGRVALDKELAQYFNTREPFAIALLDVDGFQEINDTLGFAEGDGALRRLGALLTDANAGLVHRISGDEFALVMPQVTLEQAFLAAENLRTLVAGSDFALADGRSVKITAGVAHSPRDAKEAQALLNAADAALLSAKENGGNQVALPPNEEMVLKSCYYPSAGLRKLKTLAERLKQRESYLLREALTDFLRKHETLRLS